ncbi:hypothetical protein Halar_3706 [halophilic archaeon DL31]|jgi:hypothetical protein|nr:hypothetical protein Halar_3706 [halophilic archaeon DL31]
MSTHNTPDDSTSTEPTENLADWDTNIDPDYTPAPIHEDPHKNTTNPPNAASPQNPLGQLYSGDFGDLIRATHIAYGRYHGDITTEVTYTQTTTDPTTNTETTDVTTEEFLARSLHYHSALVTPDRAIDALKEMPPTYNHFNREAVIDLVSDLAPNTKIGVARENSPALYIWHNDLPALADQINEHLTGHKYPDELGVVDTGGTHTYPAGLTSDDLRDQQPSSWELVRMWWD